MQAGATAWFAGGVGVFYGIYKAAEMYDKPSTQPFVRCLCRPCIHVHAVTAWLPRKTAPQPSQANRSQDETIACFADTIPIDVADAMHSRSCHFSWLCRRLESTLI